MDKEKDFNLFATIIMDTIWFGRNQKIHKDINLGVMQMITRVKHTIEELCRAQKTENMEKGIN